MTDTQVQELQPAPDFILPAIGNDDVVKNSQVQLSALRNRIVVLYFYPKDNTGGCVIEACSFRDANHVMQQRGIVVLGVSRDSIRSHQKFAQKHNLPFPLLVDPDATVSQLYGAYGEKFGKLYRGVLRKTFLIDKEGIVRKIWDKVKPGNHANEVLATIEALAL
jgi:peroxiredoxin Q/BCP